MIKRQIEIEDDLQDRVNDVKYELRENFIEYLKENSDVTDFDTYYQKQGKDFLSKHNIKMDVKFLWKCRIILI